ncbi:MAG: hypothetical protein KGI79_03545, partial [Patescibacteria group bacterium]|nr:hypothetical protein [Patescibacteria group bacterium]
NWTFAFGNLGSCQWTCSTGYIHSGDSCQQKNSTADTRMLLSSSMVVPAPVDNSVTVYSTPTPTPTPAPVAAPAPTPASQYHSADTNHDWRIDDSELNRVTVLYNYRNGNTRTGEYHCSPGTVDGYDVGPGDHSCAPHSADENKDWMINLSELTRVIELKNAAGGYRVQAGTEDGFAPITTVAAGNYGALNVANIFTALNNIIRIFTIFR